MKFLKIRLQNIYYDGKYVEKDINNLYFLKSANQNYHDSQLKLGHIYFNGINVKRLTF